jgi:hypothetical protein
MELASSIEVSLAKYDKSGEKVPDFGPMSPTLAH